MLLLLALGVGDFGRAFYYSVAVSNSSRAAAQYALRSNYTNTSGITTAARNDAGLGTNLNVTQGATAAAVSGNTGWFYCYCPGVGAVSCSTGIPCAGSQPYELYVDVNTSYTFNPMTAFSVNFGGVNYGIPASIALNSETQMRFK